MHADVGSRPRDTADLGRKEVSGCMSTSGADSVLPSWARRSRPLASSMAEGSARVPPWWNRVEAEQAVDVDVDVADHSVDVAGVAVTAAVDVAVAEDDARSHGWEQDAASASDGDDPC